MDTITAQLHEALAGLLDALERDVPQVAAIKTGPVQAARDALTAARLIREAGQRTPA